ncbi:hypothetical protein ACLOJK_025850 [Asimina triloba]
MARWCSALASKNIMFCRASYIHKDSVDDPSPNFYFYDNRVVIGVGGRLWVFVEKDKRAVRLTFLVRSTLLGQSSDIFSFSG